MQQYVNLRKFLLAGYYNQNWVIVVSVSYRCGRPWRTISSSLISGVVVCLLGRTKIHLLVFGLLWHLSVSLWTQATSSNIPQNPLPWQQVETCCVLLPVCQSATALKATSSHTNRVRLISFTSFPGAVTSHYFLLMWHYMSLTNIFVLISYMFEDLKKYLDYLLKSKSTSFRIILVQSISG